MKNSNTETTENLKKCPYQVSVYGENNCEVIYRTSYKGDWGHWDEASENNQSESKNSKTSGIENTLLSDFKFDQNLKKKNIYL